MKKFSLAVLFDVLIICAFSAVPLVFTVYNLPLPLAILLTIAVFIVFVIINIAPGNYRMRSQRYRILAGGSDLLIAFLAAMCIDIVVLIWLLFTVNFDPPKFIPFIITSVIACAAVFWNGIIRVYLTSRQLRFRLRALGIIFGMWPIVNIIILVIIIRKTRNEAVFEAKHDELETARRGQNICETKYPILLVHGVFFRDRDVFNYWGRIPDALKRNGAKLYYGKQQSALSVKDSAAELAVRIKEVIAETGAEKINIIAHSKGGLDSRYAISRLDCGKYVASLTTVNTPHRGCIFVDKVFESMSAESQKKMADVYNAASRVRGDTAPDFLSAVGDLRKTSCDKLNEETPDYEGIYYQSVGSVTKNSRSGRFPMDISYPFVKKSDGENDGLVSIDSMKWGEKFYFIPANGRRGVTHSDVIDLNRENFDGFDVREFFVQLVADLKNMGY
mgnify:CR=1 FL=1